MARTVNLFLILCCIIVPCFELCSSSSLRVKGKRGAAAASQTNATCTCGVFLSSQIVKGAVKSAVEDPVISVDVEEPGNCAITQCSTKCLEEMVKFLPTSSSIICASVDRDVYKEKAHLFLNVCDQGWKKSKISTQKAICCENSKDYKCPVA
ncbi:follicle cell protein 3C-1-like [Planococcus citri]|uniref:follicle cell protein 3C-1-like n=1 Tax=Planococcus citri TaxID=170843 RepID=UPI0031F80844